LYRGFFAAVGGLVQGRGSANPARAGELIRWAARGETGMNAFSLLQVSPEELEWLKQQPDFLDAYHEFTYSNSIRNSYNPDEPPGREITFEDYEATLLMTSCQPPLEGWFSPEEMLFSRALIYGKQEIDEDYVSYNSPEDVAVIASELEKLPLASLRVIFEEGTIRFGNPDSPAVGYNEEVLRYQSALFKWVTEFYQSAKTHGYAIILHTH
jgi:hypothetical protein